MQQYRPRTHSIISTGKVSGDHLPVDMAQAVSALLFLDTKGKPVLCRDYRYVIWNKFVDVKEEILFVTFVQR